MKTILLLAAAGLLLPACSGPTADADPTHVAVTAYLKKNLDDPASYQPARWGKVVATQQLTADTLLAAEKRRLWRPLVAHAMSAIDSLHEVKLFRGDVEAVRRTSTSGMAAAHRADSLSLVIDKLAASKDTARIGWRVWHAFRAKNKLGALVLDSAQFLVSKNGQVQPI